MKNLQHQKRLRFASVLPVAVALAMSPLGCSKDEPDKPPRVKMTTTSSVAAKQVATDKEVAADEPAPPAEFIAPFPEKMDLFAASQPPKIEPKRDAKPKTQEKPPNIRLVGFVNVGEPCAILSIDNHTTVLKPGDYRQQVKLVAINDQTATLEFKSQTWHLNLLGKTAVEPPQQDEKGVSKSPFPPSATGVPALPSLPTFGKN